MAVIDIGGGATDRNDAHNPNHTIIDQANPANDSGTITTIYTWFATTGANFQVGFFEEVSADTFTTRSDQNLGSVTPGSQQSFTGLSLAVVAGDYIGTVYTSGTIDYSTPGATTGIWRELNQDYVPCTNQAITDQGVGRNPSLYGEGATAAGWAGEFCGVTVAEFDGVTPAEIDGV